MKTVENGIPLLRACNTGITGAVDSLGNTICLLGGDNAEAYEWTAEALLATVPMYSYTTVYARYGNWLIIGFSLLAVLLGLSTSKLRFWER
jgi:apolipoprotein N-acyltransferase